MTRPLEEAGAKVLLELLADEARADATLQNKPH